MPRNRGSGCLYQQKGSAVWWIKYYRGGRPYRESTHTTDCRKAEKFLRRRLGEIATGQFLGPAVERVKIDELAEDFLRDYRINQRKSLEDAEARWKLHLQPFFGGLRAVQIGSDLVSRYVDQRQRDGAKNATINRELACLKRMFHLGQQQSPPKVYRVPRFPKLAENNVRTGFLEDSQYRKLVEAVPELWFRAFVEVARTYGWRYSELLGLKVKQLDFVAAQPTIRLEPGTTKNRDGRTVVMTQAVRQLLAQCASGKSPDDYVFTRSNGKRVRDFRGAWKRACASAGVPDLLIHDLRRTAARDNRRAGTAEGVIMKMGGWRTRSVFERYAIVTQSDLAEASAKLEADRAKQATMTENGHSYGHDLPSETAVAPHENIN